MNGEDISSIVQEKVYTELASPTDPIDFQTAPVASFLPGSHTPDTVRCAASKEIVDSLIAHLRILK